MRNVRYLGILACISVAGTGLAVWYVRPRDYSDVYVKANKRSPKGNWTAVVQEEVYNTAWVVNTAV
jgi:hypothetical protein